ncbi:DUF2271 domain-containing protein [Falsiroseomonas selenitidurans]|uniref:DUF2271 domain-containing protein n=1 Tax=Falsiroseomonas selenitidurans TaxID=2716335 RepID=A0ABX1E2Z2_9PROT|nr:DUF2271 domain-containing protein [Falsiroseomonas selenitidurans]NKC31549.1 DUF2271 domain-containing protein [Falsiroseomonas selenitidurans]
MRFLPLVATGLAAATPLAGQAAELGVTIEIPRLNVAEYHRPYVAIWVERPDQQAVATLAVWYDVAMRNSEGEKWLKDMRQWWRRAGRSMTMPADGVSGATRAPGRHSQAFTTQLDGLAPGRYALVVEAAREVGGRELLRIPFQWPPAGPQAAAAQGGTELGAVSLTLKP